MCSIGDRNSSAVIQIKPCVFGTGLNIRNVYHKRVLTFKIGSINGILQRIFGDIIGLAIGFNDYTIEVVIFVISNAIGQGIMKDNRVLIIVIVSTAFVSACGQLSDQLELELFVDCMVSAGTKISCAGAILIVEIVINFLLNSGLYNLMINCNVIACLDCLGNIHQEEGIVGMIGIAIAKVDIINDQIITCLGNGDGTVATYNVGVRGCTIRVEIVAYKTRESDAVIIGIMPFADNRKNLRNRGGIGKISADGSICSQLFQKLIMINDVFAPINAGKRRIVLTNNTLEDLESDVTVVFVEVLLSLPRFVCKRRDRHGAHHGNCQQCGQQLFDCFLHHDLRKSPFKFF